MSKKLRVKSLKTLAILHFVTKLKLLHIYYTIKLENTLEVSFKMLELFLIQHHLAISR